MSGAVRLRIDHLVVVAGTLDDGVRWCEQTLGVSPGPGGPHALMGTHNRLLRFDGRGDADAAYLEIIAIDPEAPPPGRARWFAMDARPAAAPVALVHWVARVEATDGRANDAALESQLADWQKAGLDGGRTLAAERPTPQGLLRWRIAVRDDGALQFGGALPTLIAWGERHPAHSMPPSGLRLARLVLRGLPQVVLQPLEAPGEIDGQQGPGPALMAELETPRGRVRLSTPC